MVETKRPFLYAVSHRLGPLSKLFHRDTSVTVTLVNKNFVETHGAYDREPFGKKTCTTEIQLRNLLCPELPNLSLSSLRPCKQGWSFMASLSCYPH